MTSPPHLARLQREIADAVRRLEPPPTRASGEPAAGDLYAFDLPTEAAVEWLVVRHHLDDPSLLLLAPADDFDLVGADDVSVLGGRPLTVRCSEAVWVPAGGCQPRLRVGAIDGETLAQVRRTLADLARGALAHPTGADDDPEYLDWMAGVACARLTLAERRPSPPPIDAEVFSLTAFTRGPHPAFTTPAEYPLAAASGGTLSDSMVNELTTTGPVYAELRLGGSGELILTPGPAGVQVAWNGPPDDPPPLTAAGPAGPFAIEWLPLSDGFRHAVAPLPWVDGEARFQVGSEPVRSFLVRR